MKKIFIVCLILLLLFNIANVAANESNGTVIVSENHIIDDNEILVVNEDFESKNIAETINIEKKVEINNENIELDRKDEMLETSENGDIELSENSQGNFLKDTHLESSYYKVDVKDAYAEDTEVINIEIVSSLLSTLFPSDYTFNVVALATDNRPEVDYGKINQLEVNMKSGSKKIELKVFNILGGKHRLSIYYNGQYNIHQAFVFDVKKYDVSANITVDPYTTPFGEIKYNVSLNEDINGEMYIGSEFSHKWITLVNGKASGFLKANNTVGVRNVFFQYDGNDKYKLFSVQKEINVLPFKTEILANTLSSSYGESVSLSASIKVDNKYPTLTGNISIYTGKELLETIEMINYEDLIYYFQEYTISTLTAGTHTIRYVYGGDSYYASCEKSINIQINKTTKPITYEIIPGVSEEDLIITYYLYMPEGYKYYTYNYDNCYWRVYDSDNTLVKSETIHSFTDKKTFSYWATPGKYKCVLSFNGDQNHERQSLTHYVIIKSTIPDEIIFDLNEISNDNNNLLLLLPSLASGEITLNINEKNYIFNVIDGICNIKFPNLVKGKYNYSISYSGSDYYYPFNKTYELNILDDIHRTNESPIQNISSLNNQINNIDSIGVINLNTDYKYDNNEDEGLNIIEINKPITINGNGHYIDVNFKPLKFKINSNSVTLKNIYFINIYDSRIIQWSGDKGVLNNCNFINSYYDYNSNSGIQWDGNYGQVINCRFIYQRNSNGGSIKWTGNSGTVYNSYFANNFASNNGGAIYWSGKNGTVDYCTFKGGISENGGAMYITANPMNVLNSYFFDNYAFSNGGGIYMNNARVTYCVFEKCEAAKYGGAINANNGYILDCNFKNNKATYSSYYGNIINSYGSVDECSVYGSLPVVNCSFNRIAASIFVDNINMNEGDDRNIFIKLVSNNNRLSNKEIIFKLTNGNVIKQFTAKTNVYGEITIYGQLKSLNSGNWKLFVTFIGDNDYDSYSTSSLIVVNPIHNNIYSGKILTYIAVNNLNIVYNNGKYLVATLKDCNGKALNWVSISININGIKYLTTDNNGQVRLSVNSLVPKTYTATITFEGNAKYVKSTVAVKVTVKKATPKLTAKAKTFKKSVKTKKYKITLKNNLNKVMKNTKVTIKVNKRSYAAKTNSKGVATFKINKLTKKGTFKSVITYKGDKYYNKVTKTVKIKVK